MSDHIIITRADGILTLRMNRPEKKNALTRAMYAAMTEAITAAQSDDAVRVILFLGVPGAFSSGNDLMDFMAAASGGGGHGGGGHGGAGRGAGLGTEVLAFLAAISGSAKPMVAGVDGLAIGIGTTLLMHCDASVVSDRSLLRTPFVDLGLVPEAGSSLLGPAIMGYQRAFAMLALGEDFSAEAAREAGLVGKVVSAEALEAEALALATRIAKKPPEALRLSRTLLRDAGGTLPDRIAAEAKLFAERLQSKEAQAAFMAFFAKKG
ncbi:MAG: crotonase/enoyl-CoA hydratase family protein [Rhizobiaceae bacterium]|nr:crotonase/enoyl-CoA hydratase family protein [Rhizobiaceae bacterium]